MDGLRGAWASAIAFSGLALVAALAIGGRKFEKPQDKKIEDTASNGQNKIEEGGASVEV